MTEPGVEFILDDWLIYPEKSTIKRDDQLIHLEPKIMEVLVYLIKNANRVISREELTEQVLQKILPNIEQHAVSGVFIDGGWRDALVPPVLRRPVELTSKSGSNSP